MKTNNCTDMNEARNTGFAEVVEEHKPYGFIIPAGALIGLGVGVLVDHVGSGFLVGLGLGFVASGLIPLFRKPLEGERVGYGSVDVTMLLIGAFLSFIGIGFVIALDALWPYALAMFLILMGIWFLVRGFFTTS